MGCLSIFGVIAGVIGSVIGIVFGVLGSVLGGVGIIVGVIVPLIVLMVPALVLLGILWFFVQVFKNSDQHKHSDHPGQHSSTPPHTEEPVDGDVIDVEDFEEIKDDPANTDKDHPKS